MTAAIDLDGCAWCGSTREELGHPLALDGDGDLVCPAPHGCAEERARVTPRTVTVAGTTVPAAALLSPEAVPPQSATVRAALALARAEMRGHAPSRPVPTAGDVRVIVARLRDALDTLEEGINARTSRVRAGDLRWVRAVALDLDAAGWANRRGAWR